MQDAGNLVWIDLEMTGLDVGTCTIIEIASVVTDAQLKVLAVGPDIVVHQPTALLDAMDAWNTEHHGASGLTAAVKASTVSLAEAEKTTLDFIRPWVAPKTSPLCGNSIGNDRRFLEKYMPTLAAHLHYRNVDVSTVKELVKRWYGESAIPTKKRAHRASDDIHESIAELVHYRERFFMKAPA